jgi:hypothetical protein
MALGKEPLSERQKQILRLIARHQQAKETARALNISTEVVKQHLEAARKRRVTVSPLPDQALLTQYRDAKAYTDGYSLEVQGSVTLAQYVEAFYTSPLFKVERFLITALVGKPSTDAEAGQLARAEIDKFAAWTVEGRTADQILLCDYLKWTRSWLMCVPSQTTTRLYFGTAVAPARSSGSLQASFGFGFRVLNGFHRLYARALLKAAARQLSKQRPN